MAATKGNVGKLKVLQGCCIASVTPSILAQADMKSWEDPQDTLDRLYNISGLRCVGLA